jgi:hypothetical protein
MSRLRHFRSSELPVNTWYLRNPEALQKIQLVTVIHHHHLFTMKRIKTLSLPLVSALVVATAASASAQIRLEVSSQKTYLQDRKSIKFQGGEFEVNLTDGQIVYISGCDFFRYIPPGFYLGPCSRGTNGRIISGNLSELERVNPYLLVTSVVPANVVEPRQAKLVQLTAAPASGLPRPEGGFTDNSVSLYFDLTNPLQQREYVVTRYERSKKYNSKQQAKFENEVVPGLYRYAFPRLGQPKIPAPISAQIFPMPEGRNSRNNVTSGFEFTSVNKNKWSKDGFMELSYVNPNTIEWRALSPSNTLSGRDALSFSMRVLKNQKKPKDGIIPVDRYSRNLQSIFPDYSNDSDPKLFIPNPFTSSFVLPPIFPGGTKGMVEVEVERTLNSVGVAYDFSTRKFQIPVVVVNRYSEYSESVFVKKGLKQGILEDSDGDGYNNLNEWILDSNAADSQSIPIPPVPAAEETVFDFDYLAYFFRSRIVRESYFGFTINKKLGTNPLVVETLERSKDRGKTWENFRDGYYFADGSYSKTYDDSLSNPRAVNWIVKTLKLAPGMRSLRANSPRREEIRVESGVRTLTTLGEQTGPPGTENDIYRVKVTLKK